MARPMMSVIVPTFRRFEWLLQTVQDLLAQEYSDFEVVVADQNADWPAALHADLDAIKANPRIRWLAVGSPGVVVARNRAVAASVGDVILFVDDDVKIPDRHLLEAHAASFDDTRTAAVVGRERPVDDAVAGIPRPQAPRQQAGLSPLQQALTFDRNSDTSQDVCTFSTCNGSVRRSVFLAVGGFDELFAGNSYGDDYDLALRLHERGYRIVYEPAAWLIHCRAPRGGLRLSDPTNSPAILPMAQGLWLFVLRHGHRGAYRHLVVHHVLRKTVLLKRNLVNPWRLPRSVVATVAALPLAYVKLSRGPQLPFTDTANRAGDTAGAPAAHGRTQSSASASLDPRQM
jgi:GT2 family glycosyltransferase